MISGNAVRTAQPLVCAALVGCASAGTSDRPIFSAPKDAAQLAVFEPRPDGREHAIDYGSYTDLLQAIVVDAGPSLRLSLRPLGLSGMARIIKGDTSPLRTEGNKIAFALLAEPHRAYLEDLVRAMTLVGERLDIVRLPRDEQLAYWMNLHNILVISELAKNHPVYKPQQLEVGPEGAPSSTRRWSRSRASCCH